MQHHDLHIPRIIVLILLAAALGVAILQVDTARRAGIDPVAATAQVAPVAVDAVPQALGQVVADPAPVAPVDPAPVAPPPAEVVERVAGAVCSEPHRLVQVNRDASIRATPAGRAIGTLPGQSAYLKQPMMAWVQAVSPDGVWGRVTMPWRKPVGQSGWIRLSEFAGRTTTTMLVADLSERRVRVYDGCDELFAVSSAIGRAGSPSPTGRFWVTDRVAVPRAQQGSFGTFAFGLSTVQPNLPRGWTGGDQMAIHGTGAPGSIGQAASAGCLRVSEAALERLKPLLRAGTPVIIRP